LLEYYNEIFEDLSNNEKIEIGEREKMIKIEEKLNKLLVEFQK